MKVIIDIDKDTLKDIKDGDFEFARNIVRNYQATIADAIRNGTPISDNATNGDMIKAMLPNTESRLDEKTGIILVKWADGTTKTFKASWWNAPYKKQ